MTLDPVAALHGDMGVLSPTGADTVALISNSGATRELQRLLAVFKSRPVRMATYIAVTSSSMAPLAQHSDAWLDADTASPPTDGYGEADPATPAPTCSVAVALAALDALALVLFRENCGWDAPPETRAVAFAANHCGGQLGLKVRLGAQPPTDWSAAAGQPRGAAIERVFENCSPCLDLSSSVHAL